MKRILVIIFFLAFLEVHAQRDTTQIDSTKIEIVEPPDSTEIGTPDGMLVSMEIGPGGGRIKSEDGRIELIFPAGALTERLTITIQPTTNPAPNGTGKAYQFGPSGTHFQKPVQLIFHYSDVETKQCPANLMALALQDDKGKWEFFEYEGWDSISNTLKTAIQHFTGASNIKMLAVYPQKNMISTGETIRIRLFEMFEKVKKGQPDHTWGKLGHDQVAMWKVNGIYDGDDQVGRILEEEKVRFKEDPDVYSPQVEYRAPYFLPRENPVTISVRIGIPTENGPLLLQTIVSCEVEIFDEYQILVRDTMAIWVGRGQYICDWGTFVLRVTKDHVIIRDVNNYPPEYFTEPVKRFPCVMMVDFVGCPGTVDIGSPSELKRDDKHPANVFVSFNTKRTVNAFKFQEKCGPYSTPWEYNQVEPVPNLFHFTANGLDQKIPVESRRITKYTIYVIPLRPQVQFSRSLRR